jgi:hypothetical protein
MSADRGYIARNNAERARLETLVAKWTDADLARPMPAGWTVAGVLGHLAFWDQRFIILVEQWRAKGAAPHVEVDADIDWINDAAKPMLLAVPPRKAAELTVAIARAADRAAETVSDDILSRNVAAGNLLTFARAEHRKEHLDEIEKHLTARLS